MNKLEKLKEMTEIACAPGTWNYDPYFLGMANGMIFAVALLEDKEPAYLNPPTEWLKDKNPPFTKTMPSAT